MAAYGVEEISEKIDWSKAPEDATHCWAQAQDFFKLDNGNWMVWFGNEMRWAKSTISERWGSLVERPSTPSWSGEGLPPVGVVCEVYHDGDWYETKIIGIDTDDGSCVFKTHSDYETPYDGFVSASSFRPIRTPEQIAVDERESAIKEIEYLIAGYSYRHCAELIHDNGYRRP